MSQNKTVIQGLEPAEVPARHAGSSSNPNFYSRSDRPAAARGTVVPGMNTGNNPTTQVTDSPVAPHQPKSSSVYTGKPVVGFLYSVSRTAAGEFWPLHIGQNTIGQSETCDIVLPEGTVSGEHAVIVVRKMKKPEKVIASISDARSTNGTMINGESLGFAAEECKNGDVITIGDCYELLLILVDTAELGLSVSDNFIPVAAEEDEEELVDGPTPFANGMTRPGDDFSYGGPTPPAFGGYTPAGGTVGLDGTSSPNKGGTVGM